MHFDQFNGQRLPYFPTQISPLVGTSPKIDRALHKIIICVGIMQIIQLTAIYHRDIAVGLSNYLIHLA